jgi:hypothetical protein
MATLDLLREVARLEGYIREAILVREAQLVGHNYAEVGRVEHQIHLVEVSYRFSKFSFEINFLGPQWISKLITLPLIIMLFFFKKNSTKFQPSFNQFFLFIFF